ncbi:MAG: hypothetical protein NW216_07055 [Hyphomicrobium sp.]|nr:hypothetical protein [Hyphomicrobium sp.]
MLSASALHAEGWTTYRHPVSGFSLAYPADVFQPRKEDEPSEGLVLVSRDGVAQVAVAAFSNDEDVSIADYRHVLLSENYADATIEYQPRKGRWFVLSGTRGALHFYERVTFTCGGKLINSWALYYPMAARETYDRIVEAMAKRYKPGRGATGECD